MDKEKLKELEYILSSARVSDYPVEILECQFPVVKR